MSWNKIKQAVGRTKRDVKRGLRNSVLRELLDAVVYGLGGTVIVIMFALGMANYPIITLVVCAGLTIIMGLGKLTLMTFRHYRSIKED